MLLSGIMTIKYMYMGILFPVRNNIIRRISVSCLIVVQANKLFLSLLCFACTPILFQIFFYVIYFSTVKKGRVFICSSAASYIPLNRGNHQGFEAAFPCPSMQLIPNPSLHLSIYLYLYILRRYSCRRNQIEPSAECVAQINVWYVVLGRKNLRHST